MTAIACFRVRGRPSIVGDVLVTRGMRPSALRRKLLIVNPRLVVAWTGSRVAATLAIERLLRLRENADTSLATLTRILTSDELHTDLASLQVVLVGWLVTDTEEICFRWNSTWHQEIFVSEGEPFVDGTGENQVLSSLYANLPAADQMDLDGFDDGAVLVRIVGDLMRPELHIQPSVNLGHGVAYEGAQLDDQRRFQHLPSTLFFALTHTMTREGKHHSTRVLDPVARVTHVQDAMVYDFSTHGGREALRHVILPVAGGMRTPSEWLSICRQELPESPISEYYCEWQYFECPGFVSPNFPVIYRHARSSKRLRFVGRRGFASLTSPTETERLFAFLRESEKTRVQSEGEFPMQVLPQRLPF
ncbi:MAG: hypothetical protein DID89_2727546503 [Candidatus Nitrotoga sp. CP45]|nr:MAG: hypothetical protein DID89_2727546503 [Candidatus Nitrotoga sp. CP45]